MHTCILVEYYTKVDCWCGTSSVQRKTSHWQGKGSGQECCCEARYLQYHLYVGKVE